MIRLTGNLHADFDRVFEEYTKLRDRILGYQERVKSLQASLRASEKSKQEQKDDYEARIAEKDAVIKELTNRLAHMAAVAGHDGTNTGIPTSQTPVNKKKVIPNSRRSSGRKKGGQPGHEKHTLDPFDDSEINDKVWHELNTDTDVCDACGGTLVDTGEMVSKDEFDIEIHVVRRRHYYKIYGCRDCGKTYRVQIGKRHKEKNQYGSHVQALALSLMATGNVAVNKVRMLLKGMTNAQMDPSEGFLCKLYKRASEGLTQFKADLRKRMVCRPLLYWDDTVIMIQTERACMRFYGDETMAYYTAHDAKDLDGMIEDDILTVLTKETTVMHDHNRVNYNDRFSFLNIECCQHLERDLQKITDDNPAHTWSDKLKHHISATIKKRKDCIEAGMTGFSDDEIHEFDLKVRQLLKEGERENESSTDTYAAPFERTVIKRIYEYMENYFKWVRDFSLPTTNNLSERGLRGIKSHMKISGQFDSEKTARYYADVKTYVETCRKNGINEMNALSRLCEGNPYTVAEIFS